MPPHRVCTADEEYLDLMIVERCRFVRQVSTTLVVEILQKIARIVAAQARFKNFLTNPRLAAAMLLILVFRPAGLTRGREIAWPLRSGARNESGDGKA